MECPGECAEPYHMVVEVTFHGSEVNPSLFFLLFFFSFVFTFLHVTKIWVHG
ncbi:hypothetical protein QJS04_geneDACA003246 [Acorus gramineus]|uniref:Uncharacterized protein n=1 Tax=Acorus gramineus TaxID=55184 RepID=A0AAV9BSS9_ACOGR|nr:hypothetical protein QJS04_geneDACA003246 [Acorus gramineus]